MTSMRPPSSEGGNAATLTHTSKHSFYFNEAALKRGRKQIEDKIEQCSYKTSMRPPSSEGGNLPNQCIRWSALHTSMRPPSSEGGNPPAGVPVAAANIRYFNEAALKRGRKPPSAFARPTPTYTLQ